MESLARNIERFVDGFANSSATFDVPVQDKESVAGPSYLLEEDNYIDTIINNPITRASLRHIADKYYTLSVEQVLQTSTLVTSSSYPTLHQIIGKCSSLLLLHDIPQVYVTSKLQGINALSLEVKKKSFVLVSRQATVSLSESEQCFLIGHELGHHQQGNLVCHTVNGLLDNINAKSEIFGPLISDAIEVPMKRWCRQSEFNADRAGFICCGEIEAVESLMTKITPKRFRTSYSSISELFEDHPLLKTRMEKLKEFSEQLL